MCLAVPGRIISIDQSDPELKMAKVQFGDTVKEICIQWIDDVSVGDYIMAHIGVALSKINEADAELTLNAIHEMGKIMNESKYHRSK